MDNYLQKEWTFVQQGTSGSLEVFHPVEDALKEEFLPELFKLAGTYMPGCEVTQTPVNYYGIALPDMNMSIPEKWNSSCLISGPLVDTLQVWIYFCSGDHFMLIKYGRA